MFYQSWPAAKTLECNSTPLGIQMVLGLVGATSASASVKQWSWTLLHRQHQFTYYLSQASVIDVGMLDLQSCISFAHVRVQRAV